MKPTADIVEELRLYNRWRRGDEAITAPDPTALGKLIDDAADRIEYLFASGIHTCHADCQRPLCVMRRERDDARAEVAALRRDRERMRWVPSLERLPENPDGFPRNDHVPCLCHLLPYHEIRVLQWNAFYKVWDDAEGDDFFCQSTEVSHWMPLPGAPDAAMKETTP